MPRSSCLRYSRAFSMCSSVSRRMVSGSVDMQRLREGGVNGGIITAHRVSGVRRVHWAMGSWRDMIARADAEAQAGRHGNARRLALDAAARSPRDAAALCGAAGVMMSIGDHAKAAALAERASGAEPDHVLAVHIRG